MVDYIVDYGTSEFWTYRKWNSGVAECWGIWTGTLSNYGTVLGGYGYYTSVNFPTGLFSAIPIVTYSAAMEYNFALTGTITPAITTSGCNVYLVSNGSGSRTVSFYIRVIGKWK